MIVPNSIDLARSFLKYRFIKIFHRSVLYYAVLLFWNLSLCQSDKQLQSKAILKPQIFTGQVNVFLHNTMLVSFLDKDFPLVKKSAIFSLDEVSFTFKMSPLFIIFLKAQISIYNAFVLNYCGTVHCIKKRLIVCYTNKWNTNGGNFFELCFSQHAIPIPSKSLYSTLTELSKSPVFEIKVLSCICLKGLFALW